MVHVSPIHVPTYIIFFGSECTLENEIISNLHFAKLFYVLIINNKLKYNHHNRYCKQTNNIELIFLKIIKSRYSGLDWHPPVREAATARPFTSNNITSPVFPANHNFSTRRYKAIFSAFFILGFLKSMFYNSNVTLGH